MKYFAQGILVTELIVIYDIQVYQVTCENYERRQETWSF